MKKRRLGEQDQGDREEVSASSTSSLESDSEEAQVEDEVEDEEEEVEVEEEEGLFESAYSNLASQISLLTVEELALGTASALAMSQFYTKELCRRVSSLSYNVDSLNSILLSKDNEIKRLDMVISSLENEKKRLEMELSIAKAKHEQERQSVIERYKASDAFKEGVIKNIMHKYEDNPYIAGWNAFARYIKSKYPHIPDEDLEEPSRRAPHLAKMNANEEEARGAINPSRVGGT